MARKISGPRKRRTRQHVIADQSINHVERFIIEAGHIAQRVEKDYGYDLLLFTFDEEGYAEPGLVRLQLKATESLPPDRSDHEFDLDIRDYNLWMVEEFPVFLVLFDASRRRAWWLDVQSYFHENVERRPKKGAKSVRVRISIQQVVNRRAIAKMRELKEQAHLRIAGELS